MFQEIVKIDIEMRNGKYMVGPGFCKWWLLDFRFFYEVFMHMCLYTQEVSTNIYGHISTYSNDISPSSSEIKICILIDKVTHLNRRWRCTITTQPLHNIKCAVYPSLPSQRVDGGPHTYTSRLLRTLGQVYKDFKLRIAITMFVLLAYGPTQLFSLYSIDNINTSNIILLCSEPKGTVMWRFCIGGVLQDAWRPGLFFSIDDLEVFLFISHLRLHRLDVRT